MGCSETARKQNRPLTGDTQMQVDLSGIEGITLVAWALVKIVALLLVFVAMGLAALMGAEQIWTRAARLLSKRRVEPPRAEL